MRSIKRLLFEDKYKLFLVCNVYLNFKVVFKIIINGRNTYQINGSAATNTRVSDMFHSVKMNVNNPHFLIMQGRITQVLNMKPMEVFFFLRKYFIIFKLTCILVFIDIIYD